jgi:3-oxoacyl-[acyl-carrier protein] reductase
MKTGSQIIIDLTGKTALVTGGTRGIGQSIGEVFMKAGAKVILTGTRKDEIKRLNESNASDQVSYKAVDFSEEKSTTLFLDWIKEQNKIDILVNNAGVNRINLNTDTSSDDYEYLNNVNLKAPYLICREVSKLMKVNNFGRIVNITSIWSTITKPGRSLYTLSKWGLVGLTKTLSIELAENNILVNAVGPGFTLTELTASTNTPEEIKKIAGMIPIKRMAQPIEIANLVLFLASDLNSYLTGQNIIIDGGYTTV